MYYLFKLNQFKTKQNRIIRIMPTEEKNTKKQNCSFSKYFLNNNWCMFNVVDSRWR